MPPVATTVILPSLAPLQLTSVVLVCAFSAAGSLIVALVSILAPFPSVTVTPIVPAAKLDAVGVVCPSDPRS